MVIFRISEYCVGCCLILESPSASAGLLLKTRGLLCPRNSPRCVWAQMVPSSARFPAGEGRNPWDYSAGFIPGRVQAPEPQKSHYVGHGRGKMSHRYCLLSRSSFSDGESSHGFPSYWLVDLGPCCCFSPGLSSHIYRSLPGDGYGLPSTIRSQVYKGRPKQGQNRSSKIRAEACRKVFWEWQSIESHVLFCFVFLYTCL